MSPCGTFALVGSEGGHVYMFNLQSGMQRQRFPATVNSKQLEQLHVRMQAAMQLDTPPQKYERGEGKHDGEVTGIQVDSLNKTVITCGADGKVKFWQFSTGLLLHELDWTLTSTRAMRYHRPSDLIALSCDDGSIRVIDIDTRKLVRELWGAKGSILDFTFSNDGRWIVSCSADSVIRVHDLATGHLIEALRFRSQPVALAFSTTGEYLATAHQDTVGVHIWTNRTLFGHVPTRRINPDDIIDMDAPSISADGTVSILDSALTKNPDDASNPDTPASTIDQLSSDLLTLSLVPKPRWQTLLHLDTIRERNKPTEAPKKPQSAPFFLPSAVNPAPLALPPTEDEPTSRITSIADPSVATTTSFTHLLAQAPTDPFPVLTLLASLPPSQADVAIRTLDPAPPYTELVNFVDALTWRLKQKRDYELVQTWMAVFLRCHAGVVVESEEVKEAVRRWREESGKEAERVGVLVG